MRRITIAVLVGATLAGCAADDATVRPLPKPMTVTVAPSPSVTGTPLPEKVRETRATLDLDIVSTAAVHLIEHADGRLDVELDLGRGSGAFDPSRHLTGSGKVSRFPEADTTLYSATIAAPPFATGRCGTQPVSLAFALRRVGANDRVSGAVTAYCGENRWFGAPAQVLRLTGALPIAP